MYVSRVYLFAQVECRLMVLSMSLTKDVGRLFDSCFGLNLVWVMCAARVGKNLRHKVLMCFCLFIPASVSTAPVDSGEWLREPRRPHAFLLIQKVFIECASLLKFGSQIENSCERGTKAWPLFPLKISCLWFNKTFIVKRNLKKQMIKRKQIRLFHCPASLWAQLPLSLLWKVHSWAAESNFPSQVVFFILTFWENVCAEFFRSVLIVRTLSRWGSWSLKDYFKKSSSSYVWLYSPTLNILDKWPQQIWINS